MKSKIAFMGLLFLGSQSFAQNGIELTCRTKAKEVAAQAYSSCVIETRNAKSEELRNNYQKELAALKAKYDKELEKVNGNKASSSKKTTEATDTNNLEIQMKGTTSTKATPKNKLDTKAIRSAKVIKTELPRKTAVKVDAIAPAVEPVSVQVVTDENKVIAVDKNATTAGLDESAANANEETETTEVPVE